MNLKKLQYFIKAAEYENMTRTAEELYISQPALSRIIHDMEEEIGYSLFDRKGKKIVLNENGRIFYRYARTIISAYKNAQNQLADYNQGRTEGICMWVRVASSLLPDLVKRYREQYPRIKLQIEQQKPDIKEEYSYDVILDAKKDPVFSEQEIFLLKEKILLAIPEKHPLEEKEKIFLEDIMAVSMIGLSKTSSMSKMLETEFLKRDVKPKYSLITNNPHSLRSFVSDGIGIAFVAEKTWAFDKNDTKIQIRPIEDFHLERYIYMKYNERKYLSRETRKFGKFLKTFFDCIK